MLSFYIDSPYAEDADSFHDAGFDAYATGLTFLRVMTQVVYGDKDSENKRLDFSLNQVTAFMGKVFVMRSDISFIHLNSEDGTRAPSKFIRFRNPRSIACILCLGFPVEHENKGYPARFPGVWGCVRSVEGFNVLFCYIEGCVKGCGGAGDVSARRVSWRGR